MILSQLVPFDVKQQEYFLFEEHLCCTAYLAIFKQQK